MEESVSVTMPSDVGSTVLPALRGIMGDRAYYVCLMSLQELGARVNYAKEIHSSVLLSDMIQRALEDKRSEEIAAYLMNTSDRFFNSLVVAVYDGEPTWHPLSNVESRYDTQDRLTLSEETIESVGFLTLRGDEKLFALDGQHRLAGIKKAIYDDMVKSGDEVSVIFLGHKNTQDGLQATRRLFTTLNKTAKPVSKNAVIALDEDDVMAICVRHLIEHTRFFRGRNAADVASSNMPPSNRVSLTTVDNLYDVLRLLFTKAKTEIKKSQSVLRRERPVDSELYKYIDLATRFFEAMEAHMEELGEYFKNDDKRSVVDTHRGLHGGSVLFRPVGLAIFTEIVARLTKDLSLDESVRHAAKLPRTLADVPYAGLMWDGNARTISSARRSLVRDLLLHMTGLESTVFSEEVKRKYRDITGDEKAELPAMISDGASGR